METSGCPKHWRWAGAIRRGAVHVSDGSPCQDSAAVLELCVGGEGLLVGVVCDGAGSASQSKRGSFLVSQSVISSVRHYFHLGGKFSALDRAVLQGWLSTAQDGLVRKAAELDCTVKDLYTTVTIALVGEKATHIAQVGDSACAVLLGGRWQVPIWPMNGLYANETYFLHRFPQTRWEYVRLNGRAEALAMFTDGPAELLLEHKAKAPFVPFLEQVIPHLLSDSGTGRSHKISNEIGAFLDSSRVCDVSSDDKTLILAGRTKPCS